MFADNQLQAMDEFYEKLNEWMEVYGHGPIGDWLDTMIDLEEYKKTALITDRSGMSAAPDECVYEFGEVEHDGKVFDWVKCKTHGHGGMREKS